MLGTSFTAEDEDILGVDEDYTALENDLRSQVDNIESTHPGYDEYRYALDEIGHNPYGVAPLLLPVLIAPGLSVGSSITVATVGALADKLRTGLKISVILSHLPKRNQEI